MSLTSRGTRAAARSFRQSTKSRAPRRNASGSHGHDHDLGAGQSALHLPDANPKGTEGLGIGLYLTLASIPVFYVGYSLAIGDPDNSINKMFEQYKEGKKDTAAKDILHMTVLQQAVAERSASFSFPRETQGTGLRYTEFFNAGSPWNNVAGQTGADMRELEEHYRKVQGDAENEKLSRQAKGEIQTVYDAASPTIYDPPHTPGFPQGKSGSG